MAAEGKRVWMDGEFVDADKANVGMLTQTLHYGYGVFEGIRCYKLKDGSSAIFRLKEHVRRIFDGMKILMMDSPFTEEQLIEAHVKCVKANDFQECYLRPLVYCGTGSFGIGAVNPTHCAIMAREWGTYLGEGALEKGIRAKVSSFARQFVNTGMVRGKICGQYVSSMLAKREVQRAGYDEAIMLDVNGYVAECTGENLFAVHDGIIYTAPLSSPILPGVTRDTMIKLAREAGIEVREEIFTRDFLYLCDEIFLTGTAAELTPVCEVDNRTIGAGKAGPIALKLQKIYFDTVRGVSDKHKEWLTYIK